MRKKCYLILSLFFLLFGSSCFVDIPENITWNADNYDPAIVISSSNHLAFPDLFFHDSVWYICYREADDHIYKNFSKIKVLQSDNFKNWEECSSFEIKGWDLRDPKFSFNNITGEFYLHIFAVSVENNTQQYGFERNNFYTIFHPQKKSFGDETTLKKIEIDKGFPDAWLWRPTWYQNNMFVVGYLNNQVRFYKYRNLNELPLVFAAMNDANECSLSFKNDTLYFVARTTGSPRFGKINTNVQTLTNMISNNFFPIIQHELPLKIIGGPNMIIMDSSALIGGRGLDENFTTRTFLYEYSLKNGEFKEKERFISYGDNSYPGMVLKDSLLYGIYYTQSNDLRKYQIRSFIINVKL